MKKQVWFYVLWDFLFTVYLYVYCTIYSRTEHSYYRGTNFYQVIMIPAALPIVLGVLISLLVYISNQYQFTKKLAVLELVLVGGLALYLTTALLFPAFLSILTGGSIPKFFAIWLSYGNTPVIIGSLLLGYELFAFIIRIIRLNQVQ